MVEPHRDGNAYRGGRVYVMREKCKTCVFRPPPVGAYLGPGGLREIVDANLSAGSALTCHTSIYDDGLRRRAPRRDALCRGFVDSYRFVSYVLTMAYVLDVVEEVGEEEYL